MGDDRVMVFAPAPQLTITVEQPADHVEIHVHPGGQGVWQARMLVNLGVEVVFCTTLGGELGRVLRPLLAAEDVDLRVVEREMSSGGYIHDRRAGQREEIADVPGHPLSRHDMDEVYDVALAAGLRTPVSVLSGPSDPSIVDADLYRRLATDLGAHGGRVVIDLSGDYLSAALPGRPAFVKVSHEELIADGRAADDSEAALLAALESLCADGAGSALVSRAGAGALAMLDGKPYRVAAPRMEAVDPRGAGDSMTAGVAAVLARDGDLRDAVRTGAAAGALNVTRHGLGTGHAEAIATLTERVTLEAL
ncbi:PfkB family carbohydrate kinase [Asanoa sp. WMMD1127]|uniref:1-phosphofructokinase family hexose kinase n=1 Tax=Asanoa sp. WMMD1127 TaxID=3016107 RepID=UPI002415D7FF|nr:PfkB family carbohydrate kinase [Asanoa sp. WMMD1127]MDG4825621.1 PfkB family carbohydrate kinase [Asanoa sp. WMMD1127]